MSSGLANVLKTRTYRERSQPAARQRFGLLEKHKDYKLRARDYHKKQDALNALREKAAFKNQDEFYFGMVHTKMKAGATRADEPSVYASFRIEWSLGRDLATA